MRSVYVGRGETASFDEWLINSRAAQRDDERQLAGVVRARHSRLEAEVERACEIVETLATGALLAAGFRTHKRQWRRKRHG